MDNRVRAVSAVSQIGEMMFRTLLLVLLVLIVLAHCSRAHAADPAPWSKTDKALFGGLVAISAYDMAQTDQGIRSGKFYEMNPLLGSHPSTARLIGTHVFCNAGILWLADTHPKWRRTMLVIANGIEISAVAHNISIGMNFKF